MAPPSICAHVLGPVRVHLVGGADLTPSGPLQRRLLALLLLRRGSTLGVDAAVEVLWPGVLPDDPAAALQNHVARLRKLLPDDAVQSVGSSYRLDVERFLVDADRLTDLLTADATTVVDDLRMLLDDWHGPAYPDLDHVDEALAEAGRLDELRLRAQEVIAEARLTTGDLDGLVADLTRLVESQPLRERPRALLMDALVALGRHVEALRTYDDFRRLLADELGIEPSAVLSAHHAALLAGSDARTPRESTARLPTPATTLIGRTELVGRLIEHLEIGRLVSLVGPGGVGKTRLLIELGHHLVEQRPERPVVWCELAHADDASLGDVVAAALGIDGRPGVPMPERMAAVIGDDELVLLLDNCEHVVQPAAETVDALLRRCPNLRVAATTRERLRLPGERLCPVPPLPAADTHSPAVRLFVERAAAVAPDFDPDPDQLGTITEIVHRLDGLPLAIELAAARLHGLELSELAAGLDHRFELLSTGYRTSDRHGSLAAAVSWSFDSLAPDLRRCFSSLSVFARSFTARDVAAVCGLAPAEVSDLLAALVEQSLLQRAGGGRYSMLETLRAYGSDQLRVSDADQSVRERHARWMVEWIEEADRDLALPGRPVLDEIDDAIPELRSALLWLIDHGLFDHAGRLAVALVNYGFLRLRPDVLGWAELVLDRGAARPTSLVPSLLAASSYAAWMGGDVERSAELVDRALVAEREAGLDPVARVRIVRGNVDLFAGRLDAAARWYLEAIDAAGRDPAERLFARSTLLLAWGYAGDSRAATLADDVLAEVGALSTPHAAYAWYCTGEADLDVDADRARERLGRAVELAEATNASFIRGIAGSSLVSIESRIGDPEQAMHDSRRLIEHWRRSGMWSTQWTTLRAVAALLERVGRYHDAAILEGAVRSTHEGHRIFGADAAALDALGDRLRVTLGEEGYRTARTAGEDLDGAAAVDHALRSLRSASGG